MPAIRDLVKDIGTYAYPKLAMSVARPTFVDDLEKLNIRGGIAELHVGVREAIWVDVDGRAAFLKCGVTSAYHVAGKYFNSNSVQKLIDRGEWDIVTLHELRLGRWVFRRGDLEKADRFRAKQGVELVGPRATSSYDLRGETVR